ncbi:PLAC8 family [Fragilaria crotonensis]|nr:PLAC8 family [Fragilaria crotonensis]
MAVVSETAEVVAPSNLEGGYHLEVDVNGVTRTVIVPEGGVVMGQTFVGDVVPSTAAISDSVVQKPVNDGIPTGQWRDGLCDCCIFGPFHSMCCLSYWLGPVVLGQVMTRMSRNWIGGPGNPPDTNNTYMTVLIIFLVYVVLWIIFYSVLVSSANCTTSNGYYDDDYYTTTTCTGGSTYTAMSALLSIINISFSVYILVALCQTRRKIRDKYNIPPSACGGCDDCCCSFWCPCCTVNQMARHTNDYRAYPVECCTGACFNKTGQPPSAPVIVV